jgi:hypothetical protein
MATLAMINYASIQEAKEEARKIHGAAVLKAGLASPMGNTGQGLLERAWARIEDAIDRAASMATRIGETVQSQIDSLVESTMSDVQSIIGTAAEDFKKLRDQLLDRLGAFAIDLFKRQVSRVPASIDVNGSTLKLESVKYSQKITFNTSLKASLSEVLSVVGEGELTIETSYSH